MTKKLTEIFKPFDVIVVPFPFTDRTSVKKRPALVLSTSQFQQKSSHVLLAMITSSENAEWPLDVEMADLESAGLSHHSRVRMKLFTLDESLILRKAGSLSKADRKRVSESLKQLLGF